MMLGIAILYVILWSGRLFLLRLSYLSLADHYRRQVGVFSSNDASWAKGIKGQEQVNAMMERELAKVERHRDMAQDSSEHAKSEAHAQYLRSHVAFGKRVVQETQSSLTQARARRAYYEELSDKYRKAASHPWRVVPPDPPPP
jgi:hypothetical protein